MTLWEEAHARYEKIRTSRQKLLVDNSARKRGREGRISSHRACAQEGDFSRVRQIVWHWYRSEVAGNEDLSMTARFVGWALCERWRYETWSSHDAISYYAKMTAVNRKSVGKAIAELSEQGLIWIVLEGEPKRLRKSQSGGKKHFLLVGLADLVRE